MEQLGIEPVQLLTQVFNFAIMVGLLTYFLYKPILKTLKERKDKIAEGLAYTEKMKAEAEKTEIKRNAILAEAREEAASIIEEAKKSGKHFESEIIAKAHEEARAVVEKGKSDIDLERVDMEKKLKAEMINVAAAITRKVLESSLTQQVQKGIIDKKIKAIARQIS